MTTKEKILKSALKLFAKQGIDKTSTAQITKDVGIASGTLFVHFKTKQALIDTIYLRIKRSAFAGLAQKIESTKSIEDNVKKTAEITINYFIKNYAEFIFMGLVDNDPQVSQEAVETAYKEFEPLIAAFSKWHKDGAFKNLELKLLLDILWSNLIVIIKYCKSKKLKKVDPKYLETIWDAIKK